MNKSAMLFLVCFLLLSCKESTIINIEIGVPKIEDISSNITYRTDTMKIIGEHFPPRSQKNFIEINDSIIISSFDCILWRANRIEFIVPDSLTEDSRFRCIFGIDTTDYFSLKILPYPPFAIAEIPAGQFKMGSLAGLDNEKPIRNVYLSRDIYVGATELTQRLYEFVMSANPSTINDHSMPVYNVTWQEAIKFCNRLSELDGLSAVYSFSGDEVIKDTSANGWRLPTEAEWEYIARGTISSDGYGNDIHEYAWINSNSGGLPHSVARKKANEFGVFDMLGNVREWCWDYYDENYYQTADTINPLGPESGTNRVSRGGSYAEGKSYARFSSRQLQFDGASIGIRIVRNK